MRMRNLSLATVMAAGLCWLSHAPGQTTPATAPVGKVVYASDFAKEAGPEWSFRKTAATPRGQRHFLGELSQQEVSLSLKGLPAHRYVRLKVDLYVIRAWDGEQVTEPHDANSIVGPGLIRMNVAGGQMLLRSTFSNVDLPPPYSYKQSFPDLAGTAQYDPYFGANDVKSLGYTHYYGAGQYADHPSDAVYKLDMVFPHQGDALKLLFASESHPKTVAVQSWGLANVRVEAWAEAPNAGLDQAALGRLYNQLTGRDAMAAHQAMWELAAAGDKARQFVGGKISMPDEKTVERLIAQLDDDDWRIRDNASKELDKIAPVVLPSLERAAKESKSIEVVTRVERILATARETGIDALSVRRVQRLLSILAVKEQQTPPAPASRPG